MYCSRFSTLIYLLLITNPLLSVNIKLTKEIYKIVFNLPKNYKFKEKSKIRIKFDSVKEQHDSNYVNFEICITENNTLNGRYELLEQLNDSYVSCAIKLDFPGQKRYVVVTNSTIDFCDPESVKNGNLFNKMITEEIAENLHMPHVCPIPNGTYFLKGFRFHDELLPAYTHSMFKHFQCILIFEILDAYQNRKPILKITITGTIEHASYKLV